MCVKDDAGIDLEILKVYEVVPDESAARDDFLRVIDESGEDYLYPASYFAPIELSEEAAHGVEAAAGSRSHATG